MMQPDPATEWFAVRGYSLRFWEEDSAVWVDLILIRTGVVSWPRYGKGKSVADAAQRAVERYREEQGEG